MLWVCSRCHKPPTHQILGERVLSYQSHLSPIAPRRRDLHAMAVSLLQHASFVLPETSHLNRKPGWKEAHLRRSTRCRCSALLLLWDP